MEHISVTAIPPKLFRVQHITLTLYHHRMLYRKLASYASVFTILAIGHQSSGLNAQQRRAPRAAVSSETLALYEPGSYKGVPYRLMKPIDFDPNRSYPLILSLHGAGGRGQNNLGNLRNWNELMANESLRRKHPCFVLAPQTNVPWMAPESPFGETPELNDEVRALLSDSMISRLEARSDRMREFSGGDLGKVIEFIELELTQDFKIDRNRIYCLGHSMGGGGTFNAIYLYPDLFEGAVPTASFSGPGRDYSRIKDVPIWTFHGDNDPTVPYESTAFVFDRLKELGGNMKFTTLSAVKHAAALPAFGFKGDDSTKGFTTRHASKRTDRTEDIWDWLFAQNLSNRAEGGYSSLFNGRDLDAWQQTGGAGKFYVEENTLVGEAVAETPSSFLCTREIYSDFELIFEFKADGPINSGVQFRSNVYAIDIDYPNAQKKKNRTLPAGRIHGYQAEIDPNQTSRVWTGGVYDQSRRGWLFPGLRGGDAETFAAQGKGLYRSGLWNEIKVRCQGDRIQTWLNGEPRADFRDKLTPSGVIAIQVHRIGGKKAHLAGESVRFRRIRLNTL